MEESREYPGLYWNDQRQAYFCIKHGCEASELLLFTGKTFHCEQCDAKEKAPAESEDFDERDTNPGWGGLGHGLLWVQRDFALRDCGFGGIDRSVDPRKLAGHRSDRITEEDERRVIECIGHGAMILSLHKCNGSIMAVYREPFADEVYQQLIRSTARSADQSQKEDPPT